jgi:murein tripeptide amidase MpaA
MLARRLALACLLAAMLLGGLALPAPVVNSQALPPTPAAEVPLVVRIYFSSLAERDRLAGLVDALEESTAGGYVGALVSPAEYQTLLAAGYRIEIDQARTALLRQPAASLPGQVSGIGGYPCYRTVEETYASMSQLALDHPNLATWIDIGDSWEKLTFGGAPGYDLRVLILTNHARPGPKPVFFLMAAIHAREYSTAEIAARYAEYLVSQYGIDPDVTWLLDYFEVHILPQANPDGRKVAETGIYQRKNTNNTNGGICDASSFNQYGTDLNRNSSFLWGSIGYSDDPCSQIYRGPSAASEPETQAIQNYVAGIFPDQRGPGFGDAAPPDASGVLVTLHSYARSVLFPWGNTDTPAPNGAGLQTLARKFGYFNGYQVCQPSLANCLYATSGTTDDWAYGEFGVAAFTFEVGTAFFEGCDSFESDVYPENLPALVYAFKAARRPYQAPSGPDTLQVSTPVTTVVAGEALTLTAVADDTRYDSGGWGSEPAQPIAAARYSLDAPSWVTGTVTHPLAAADGTFSSTVEPITTALDTTGWSPGRHLVFVESQDAAGNWGVPSAVFVWPLSPDYYFTLAPASQAQKAFAGETVTYTLNLTQLGVLTDTFTVTVAGTAWPVDAPAQLGPLAATGSAHFTVSIAVPPGTPAGTVDTAEITVTSAGDPEFQRTATLATAIWSRRYFPVFPIYSLP